LKILYTKTLLLLLVAAFVASCSKDTEINGNSPATMQYKVNGELVTMTSAQAGTPITFYKFQFSGSPTNYDLEGGGIAGFTILSDSLRVGNYVYDSASQYLPAFMSDGREQSALHFSGDNININITRYANGYISGNFTAKLSPTPAQRALLYDYSRKGTTLITEGLFTNVPCIY
jgi:hypothetical protein